jgi:hypothetical protein
MKKLSQVLSTPTCGRYEARAEEPAENAGVEAHAAKFVQNKRHDALRLD